MYKMVVALCFAYVAFWNLALGLMYVSAQQLMPWHQQAMGVEYADLPAHQQTVLISLLRLGGAGSLAVGAATVFFLCSFVAGRNAAAWAVMAIGLIFWPAVFLCGWQVSQLAESAANGTWLSASCVAALLLGAVVWSGNWLFHGRAVSASTPTPPPEDKLTA